MCYLTFCPFNLRSLDPTTDKIIAWKIDGSDKIIVHKIDLMKFKAHPLFTFEDKYTLKKGTNFPIQLKISTWEHLRS